MAGPALGFLTVGTLGLWLGSIVFLSFVAAPVLFRMLGRAEAARVMRFLFPSYYSFGAACGAVLVVSAAIRALTTPEPDALHGTVAMIGSVMLGLTLYSWRVLLPRIDRIRRRLSEEDPTEEGTGMEHEYFRRLHQLSVRVNGLVLLLGSACLALAYLST